MRLSNRAKSGLAFIAVILMLFVTILVYQLRSVPSASRNTRASIGGGFGPGSYLKGLLAGSRYAGHGTKDLKKNKNDLQRASRLALQLQFEPKANQPAERMIREVASRLSVSELSLLSAKAVSESTGNNERNAALFILIQAGPNALDQLSEVAVQPIRPFKEPGDDEGREGLQRKFEIALRVKALEALDLMTKNEAPEVRDAAAAQVARVASRQVHPTLQFLANLSLSGLREGRPGKLQRFIDQTFDEGTSK